MAFEITLLATPESVALKEDHAAPEPFQLLVVQGLLLKEGVQCVRELGPALIRVTNLNAKGLAVLKVDPEAKHSENI